MQERRNWRNFDWLWLQLAAANMAFSLALRLWGFQQVLAGSNRLAGYLRRTRREPPTEFVEDVRLRIRKIKRHGPVRGKCLSRSLAIYWVLRRYSVESSIRIGVKRGVQNFIAHAWVEVGGQPVNAGPEVNLRYAVFEQNFGA